MGKTSIEWTDATWNPVRARNLATGGIGHFCTHVSEGCRNCYAERLQRRFRNPVRYAPQDRAKVEIFLDEKTLTQPLRWKKPRMIFPGSMTDLFGDFVTDDTIDRIFAVMALCRQHTFQVLTKRPERMRDYVSEIDRPVWIMERMMQIDPNYARNNPCAHNGRDGDEPWAPIHNVWLGVSVEDQKTADERIPLLLDTPAAIRFISAEPLLGPIDLHPKADDTYQQLSNWYGPDGFDPTGSQPTITRLGHYFPRLDWVIAGGESGPGARPSHPDWFRSLRDQCAAAGTAFLFKQWGEYLPVLDRDNDDPDWRADYVREFGHTGKRRWLNFAGGMGFHGEKFHVMERVGKKRAGRLLDGVKHDAFPQVIL
jgi:protein gp37